MIFRLRAGTATSTAVNVDRENGIIRGVSIITLGPVRTWPFDNDETTLAQVIELGNRQPDGVKVRLSHPTPCNDVTGRELGRTRDHRYNADKTRVLADFYALDAASRAPDGGGDMIGWLFDVAEEDPGQIGFSIYATGEPEDRLDDNGDPIVGPDGVPARQVVRLERLIANDIVDDPAANREGLFATTTQAAGLALQQAFPENIADLDQFAELAASSPVLVALAGSITDEAGTIRLAEHALTLNDIAVFINRNLDRRNISHPALDAGAVASLATRLQEPQTMPPAVNQGESRADYITRCTGTEGQTEGQLGTAWDASPLGGQAQATSPTPPTPPTATPPEATPPTAAAPTATPTAAGATAAVATAAVASDGNQAIIQAENERGRGIRAMAAMFPQADLATIVETCVADTAITVEIARERMMTALAGTDGPPPNVSMELGPTAGEKLISQAGDAICLASNIPLQGDDAEARGRTARENGLMALGAQRLAMITLQAAGVRNVDRMSPDLLFEHAMGRFSQASAVGHGTGDFPLILADSANKAMISGYNLAPITWDKWVKIGNLKDFKQASRQRLSESPLLELRPAGEPARQGTFNEQQEVIQLANYAKAVSFTRQMFINDDLGAFADLSAKMGAGANYTVERDLYANIALNTRTGPTMADSVVLFHANHANIGADNGVPTQPRLEQAVSDMMQQTGIGQDGADVNIGVAPTIFLATPAVGMIIERLIRSAYIATGTRSQPQVQELKDAIVLKVAQFVNAGVTTDWYAVAPQVLAPSYEVAFLNGNRTPRTETVNHPTVDGTTIVVSSDYDIHPTGGWQGIWKNAGV